MQFKNFIEGFKHFINPAGPARALLEEIGSQRMRIKHLQEEYRKVADWNSQYTATLGSITGSMEALIWKKDENHKYILANINHCKLMFGIDATTDCLLYIKGKTDHQMVYETYDCLGLLNTFPDLCLVSDEYVAEKKEICHFIEVGIIDDQEMLFYVVKIPQFINGKYVGTVGIGWDFTSRADFFVNLLNRWIFDKKATIIFEKDRQDATQLYLLAIRVKFLNTYVHVLKIIKCPTVLILIVILA